MTTTKNKPTRSAPELSPEARRARSEYTKKYRATHPEKVRQWNRNHWERKAAELAKAAPDPEVSED